MTKKLSESLDTVDEHTNESKDSTTIITFNMEELARYVAETSQQVKELTESFEFDKVENLSLEENNTLLALKSGHDTLRIFLEKNITNEINDYLKNF